MIQDYIFAVGAIDFSIALIPSLRSSSKPALSTAFPTAVVLFIFAATYATLSLWFAAITQTVGATLWALLAYQKFKGK